jgi:hypothetical protein
MYRAGYLVMIHIYFRYQSTTGNWENHNGPDLVQAFPKKWWVEIDFTPPNLPLPLRWKSIDWK